MSPVRTHADASAELAEAVRWYEARVAGLGGDLLAEVNTAITRIRQHPEAGNPLSADKKTRRLLLSRFPFHVVYHHRSSQIVVVAIAHLKRRPGYWKDRG